MNYEEFYEKVNKSIPLDYDEYQVARMVEIMIAKEFSFDGSYIYGNRKEKQRLLDESMVSEKMTPEKIKAYLDHFCEKKEMICIPLAAMYMITIKRIAFERKLDMVPFMAQPGSKDPHRHVNLFRISTMKPMGSVDVQRDLTRIKLGMRTKYFCNMPDDYMVDSVLSKEEVEAIDRSIGYPGTELYEDDRFDLFYDSLSNLPIDKKRAEILRYINENYPLDKLNSGALKHLFQYTLGRTEDSTMDIKIAQMEKDGVKKYSTYLRLGNDYYSYNFEKKQIMKCSCEKLFNSLVSGELRFVEEKGRIIKPSKQKGKNFINRIMRPMLGKNYNQTMEEEKER